MHHEIEARQVVQEELAREVKIIVPETAEQAQQAGLVRTELKARLKTLEEKRYSITRKLDEAKKAIMALFAPAESRLRDAITAIDRGLLEYTVRARKAAEEAARKAEEERARLEAEARKKEIIAELSGDAKVAAEAQTLRQIASVTPTISAQKIDTVTTMVRWKFEIVDEAAIPREYLMPDERKIQAEVTRLKDACKIPGIKVVKVESVRSR